MPIYTKKGDKGETGTFDGKRIPKDDLRVEVLGTLDEVNSFLGLSSSLLDEKYLKNKIIQVQRNIFRLGSIVAGANIVMTASATIKMEKEIDEWTNRMPKLSNFIFPGGNTAAASIYTTRTIVRSLERLLVRFSKDNKLPPSVLVYVNRLSDYLFTLARYINFTKNTKEEIWDIKK